MKESVNINYEVAKGYFVKNTFSVQQPTPIILASKSPRRQELLKLMGFDFQVVLREVDESYPNELSPSEIAVFISEFLLLKYFFF